MLDRVDGMIFAYPVSFLIFNLLIIWKKIAILGSTGSIGKALLKILDKDINNYEIVLLSANKTISYLIKQLSIKSKLVLTTIKILKS